MSVQNIVGLPDSHLRPKNRAAREPADGRSPDPKLHQRIPRQSEPQPGRQVLRAPDDADASFAEGGQVREPLADPLRNVAPALPPGPGVHPPVVPDDARNGRVEVPVHRARQRAPGLLRGFLLLALSGLRAPHLPESVRPGLSAAEQPHRGPGRHEELPVHREALVPHPRPRLLPPQGLFRAVRAGALPVQEVHQVPERLRGKANRLNGAVHPIGGLQVKYQITQPRLRRIRTNPPLPLPQLFHRNFASTTVNFNLSNPYFQPPRASI